MEALRTGTPAPEFELSSMPDQRVILAFYPADWSPVCGDQLALYNELLDEFAKHKAICLGISVDGAWCMLPSAGSAATNFRCCPTSNQRAQSPATTASIGPTTG